MKKEEAIINNLYTELENELPPKVLISKHEQSYNNGFYEGQLKAMELVCQKLFNKSGDELTKPT